MVRVSASLRKKKRVQRTVQSGGAAVLPRAVLDFFVSSPRELSVRTCEGVIQESSCCTQLPPPLPPLLFPPLLLPPLLLPPLFCGWNGRWNNQSEEEPKRGTLPYPPVEGLTLCEPP